MGHQTLFFKWILVVWIYWGSSHGQSTVGKLYRQVYCHFKSRRRKAERKKNGADRMAVWRIGAQSDGVEKNLHLNALLHPNNSSASEKEKKPTSFSVFPCFTPLHSLSEQLWRAHTWLPSIWLCVCTCLLMWVYLKRFFGRFLGLIAFTSSIVHVDLAAMAISTHI